MRIFSNVLLPSVLRSSEKSAGTSASSTIAQLMMAGVLIVLTGCATSGAGKTSEDQAKVSLQQLREDMILDLISSLPQLLDPLANTIQVSKVASGNTDTAVSLLIELGYGIQRVDADQGNNLLQIVDVEPSEDIDMRKSKFRVSVGDLEMTREYGVVSKSTVVSDYDELKWRGSKAAIPISDLQIAGTNRSLEFKGLTKQLDYPDVVLNAAEKPALIDGAVQYAALAPISGGIPMISLITGSVIDSVAENASGCPTTRGLNSGKIETNNRFYGEDSTFQSVLDQYNRVSREVVVFTNDSQLLGPQGKVIVRRLVSRFAENTDVIGIIGCSNGTTSLKIGNEGLALGRAKRISEELLTAGIPPDRVFDEGCWSPSTNVRGFPNRGVVIDLWRRKS